MGAEGVAVTTCLHCHNAQLRGDPSNAERHRALVQMARSGFIGCALERASFRPLASNCEQWKAADSKTITARDAWANKRQ